MVPEFSPRITTENGITRYCDNRVSGNIVVDGHRLTIHSWKSDYPGLGNTTRALQWLRVQGHTKITVIGAELDTKAAYGDQVSYWLHMQSLGLVEKLLDKHGDLIGQVKEIDEFTLRRLFDGASSRIANIGKSFRKPVDPDSPGSHAARRMRAYAFLSAFSKGELKNQAEPLEDMDLLYDLLDSDSDRYGAVIQSLFGLANNHSERAALNLLRHTRDIGLVSFDAGWECPLTFLYNPRTEQVLSSNGVQSLKAVSKGLAPFICGPLEANKRATASSSYDADMVKFGYVADLLCEDQGIAIR